MDFLLPVWLNSIPLSPFGLLHLENVGLAVEISFLCHLQAELYVVPVLEATILDFPLPVWSYNIQSLLLDCRTLKNGG